MKRGVRRLLWLETRGEARLLWRRLKTRRGMLMAIAGVLFLAAIVATLTVSAEAQNSYSVGPEGLRKWGPVALLALVGLGLFSPRGLYFKPAEVNFLFPAPVARRDLVLFNVLARARFAAVSALWLAIFPTMRGRSFAASLFGYFLCFVFVQVSAQWFAVAKSWLGERRGVRRALVLAASLAVGAAVLQRDVGVLSPLLWLTRPFIEVVSADTFAASLAWAPLATAVLLAAIVSLLVIDVDYLETALVRSKKVETERSRIRSGGLSFGGGPRSTRIRVPRFPHWNGAGPIAWRQCMEVVRSPRGFVLVLFIVLAGASIVLWFPALPDDSIELPALLLPSISLSMVFSASLMTGDNLAFDFRRDLDRMPLLKSLPISSLAVASGQIAATTLFVTAVQFVGAAIVVAVTGVFELAKVLWLVPILPLANWSAVAIDNVLFLFMPYRTVAEDPGDVAFVGRLMLSSFCKLMTILLIGGTGVGFGWLLKTLSGAPFAVGALATIVWLSAACVPLTFWVAHAFERFDVARDTPA